MPDIRFDCPTCNQSLEAPEELANQLIDCPTCKATIEVPTRSHALPEQSPPPSPSPPVPAPQRSSAPSTKSSGCMGCALMIAAFPFLLLAFVMLTDGVRSLFTPSPKKVSVSAQELGDRWPLTVFTGHIYKRDVSQGRSEVIFVAPDGTEYGLNGTALSAGYRDIHEITKFEIVSYGRQYEDVSGLISIGLYGK